MSSVDHVGDVPISGKSLIIVAAVKNVLHFRVFDGDGRMVVDTEETKLTKQSGPIEVLRKRLEGLWPPHELTEREEARLIAAVTSIVGHTHRRAKDELAKDVVRIWSSNSDLKAGDNWVGEIVKKLDEVRCFVLLLSKNSQVSAHVQHEVELAFDRLNRADRNLQSIIVFRLDNAKLEGPLEYPLAGIHTLNENVADWRDDLPELELRVREALDVTVQSGNGINSACPDDQPLAIHRL
jgi:hypothetical protein